MHKTDADATSAGVSSPGGEKEMPGHVVPTYPVYIIYEVSIIKGKHRDRCIVYQSVSVSVSVSVYQCISTVSQYQAVSRSLLVFGLTRGRRAEAGGGRGNPTCVGEWSVNVREVLQGYRGGNTDARGKAQLLKSNTQYCSWRLSWTVPPRVLGLTYEASHVRPCRR